MDFKKFVCAGLPVIPCHDKNTPLLKHSKLDDNLIPFTDYTEYQLNAPALAIKTGNKQTRIECLDFDLKNDDTGTLWKDYCADIDLTGLYVEKTPSGGYHIIYKRDTDVPGSEKLAYPADGNRATIETRGKGGYVLVAPTEGYEVVQGAICNLPIINSARVDDLKSAARALNKKPDKKYVYEQETNTQRIFNKKNSHLVLQQLLSEGWTIFKQLQDKTWLTRPGKDKGTSGTLFRESGYFYVFTDQTKYDSNKAYSPFIILRDQHNFSQQDAEKAACEEIGEVYVREMVIKILENSDKLKDVDIINSLRDLIIKDLEKDGKFFTDGNFGYYFYDRKLIPIDRIEGVLYSRYGLVKSQPKCMTVLDAIKQHALCRGSRTEIRHYSFFSGDVVYIDNFDGTVWKITDKDITQESNGIDGILFLETDNEPLQYDDKEIDSTKLFFNGLNFEEEFMTSDDQIKLFFTWILSIYFMKENKCIICATGEKGSGKSELLKKILTMIYGKSDNLSNVPEKEDDFWNAVTNNKLLIYDNADSHKSYLEDALATCASGCNIKRRELYTTNNHYTAKVDCFIGLTARTPRFTRDDVADRLIFIKLNRMKQFFPQSDIVRELKENRNAFMSGIFETIKRAIPKLRSESHSTVSRMSDFESFCVKIDPNTQSIFYKLIAEQKEFAEDAFNDLLYAWCKDQSDIIVNKTASEMSIELMDKAKRMGLTRMALSSKQVGHKLKREFDFCKIEKFVGTSNKANYKITIGFKPDKSF